MKYIINTNGQNHITRPIQNMESSTKVLDDFSIQHYQWQLDTFKQNIINPFEFPVSENESQMTMSQNNFSSQPKQKENSLDMGEGNLPNNEFINNGCNISKDFTEKLIISNEPQKTR